MVTQHHYCTMNINIQAMNSGCQHLHHSPEIRLLHRFPCEISLQSSNYCKLETAWCLYM
jgi:hypothetical protein